MNSLAKEFIKLYGEEELDKNDINLIQESFWSEIRASLYKRILKGKDGGYQWAYITGKKSRYPNGARIQLSERSIKFLWQTVEYLSSSEGLEKLNELGLEAPGHIDELVDIIADTKTDRVIKREQFRLFLKHKHEIMKFLLE